MGQTICEKAVDFANKSVKLVYRYNENFSVFALVVL